MALQVLEKYKEQNAECRNRLYADYMKQGSGHLHPLMIAILGAILGAILTAAAFLLLPKKGTSSS